jgi:hypothetical protein
MLVSFFNYQDLTYFPVSLSNWRSSLLQKNGDQVASWKRKNTKVSFGFLFS